MAPWITFCVGFKFLNIFEISSYAYFSVTGTWKNSERIFTITNSKWNDERNRYSISLIKSELICFDFAGDWSEFAAKVKNNTEVVKAVQNDAKYVQKCIIMKVVPLLFFYALEII